MANIELLIFASISGAFMLALFAVDNLEIKLISGTVAFIAWELTGILWMQTNTGRLAFGLFFGLLGLICAIFVVAWGIVILDPERRLKLFGD